MEEKLPDSNAVSNGQTAGYSPQSVPAIQSIKPLDSISGKPNIVHLENNPLIIPKRKSFFSTTLLLIVLIVVALFAALYLGVYYYINNLVSKATHEQHKIVQTHPTLIPKPTLIPTPNSPTINWPNYTNTKVGFTIKFPPRYQNVENGSVTATGSEDNTTIAFTNPTLDGFHSMYLQVLPFSDTLNELIIQNKLPANAAPDNCLPKTLVKDFQVAGKPARWYVTSSDAYPNCENKIYFTGNGHGFYFITGADMDKKEIEEVLGTFKFTDTPIATPSIDKNRKDIPL